ncbi:MAG: hypothetical protein E6J41_26290 [Chloroflexi bacterium]|nr:MAG: hypothetical protein E6J41_26290 [Chloroflexota bacterium]
MGTRLVRLDLSTGAQQAWLTGTMSLQLAGADGLGHPLVELTSDSAGRPVDKPKLWLVTGPAQPVELRPPGGLGPPEIGPAGSVLEDGVRRRHHPRHRRQLRLIRPATGRGPPA